MRDETAKAIAKLYEASKMIEALGSKFKDFADRIGTLADEIEETDAD